MLGSASMAAFMTTRISAEMPLAADGPSGEGAVTQLPGFLHEPFAAAMSQSLLLPAFIALFGVVAALFLLGFARPAAATPGRQDAGVLDADEYWDDDGYVDDDDYVEFTVLHDEPESVAPIAPVADCRADEDEGDPEPMAARHEHLFAPPVETPGMTEPVESWHWGSPQAGGAPAARGGPHPPEGRGCGRTGGAGRLSTGTRPACSTSSPMPPPKPLSSRSGSPTTAFTSTRISGFNRSAASRHARRSSRPASRVSRTSSALDYPLDFASHAHHESPDEADFERPSRHGLIDDEPEQFPFRSNGRHSRVEPDDTSSYGRHSRPGD